MTEQQSGKIMHLVEAYTRADTPQDYRDARAELVAALEQLNRDIEDYASAAWLVGVTHDEALVQRGHELRQRIEDALGPLKTIPEEADK